MGKAGARRVQGAPLSVRRASERGHVDHGWLDTRHTFSFASYHDPEWMGFRVLRVINDDRVAPGAGFGKHPHRDMEIVTYVLEGALRHEDSMGNGSVIRPGEVQRMSAGTGVIHAEHNASKTEPVHLLQIWIEPDRTDVEPSYEQKAFPEADRLNRLRLVASPDGRDGSVTIHQDARIHAALLSPGAEAVHPNVPGRHVWLHVARGSVKANGIALGEGDAAWTSEAGEIAIVGEGRAEVLLFDLP